MTQRTWYGQEEVDQLAAEAAETRRRQREGTLMVKPRLSTAASVAADAVALAKEHADRADALQRALENALEGLEEMLPYVPEFFQEKWDLPAYVERAKLALALANGNGKAHG